LLSFRLQCSMSSCADGAKMIEIPGCRPVATLRPYFDMLPARHLLLTN
jgi:hypothetical protein